MVYRNLAMVYTRQGNQREKALAALEKGVQYGGNATVLSDLDKIYEEEGVSPAKRLALIEAHQGVINRDEAIAREINLEIFAGKPDAAIQLLQSRFFRAWEGGGAFSLGDSWINANLERGHQQMAAKQYALALADYQAALQAPDNLAEATGNVSGRRGEIEYWIGNAYQAMSDAAKARSAWNKAAGMGSAGAGGPGANGPMRSRANIGGLAAGVRVEQAAPYYQALALEKLGQDDRAKAIFVQIIATGSKSLASAPEIKGPAVATPAQRAQAADAHYLIGLGQLGLTLRFKLRQDERYGCFPHPNDALIGRAHGCLCYGGHRSPLAIPFRDQPIELDPICYRRSGCKRDMKKR